MRFAASFVAAIALLVPPGCGSPAATPKADAKKPAAKVNLQIGGVEELDALRKKHQGSIVLVDYWATWCPPCVAGFPHTVELAHKYRDQGVVAISVSLDDPDQNRAAVEEFLAANNADFDNLLSRDGGGTKSTEDFNLTQVPHYRLYDRAGELHWESDPTRDDDLVQALEAALEELVAAKK